MTHEVDDTNPPPPASGEVTDFLAQHQETGAPSSEQLAKLKLRLSNVMQPNVVQLPVKPKRTFLPPEVLAAAAVVMFAVLAQLIYLATRPPQVAEGETELGNVTAAYRSGDLAGAQRLASSSCTDANCAVLSAKLLRAMELAKRIDSLDANELQELATLDTYLSGGTETELSAAIAKRKNKGPNLLDTDQLYAEARALSRENKPTEALKLVDQCLAIAPANSDCMALKATLVTAAAKTVAAYMSELSEARQNKDFERAIMIGEACIAAWPQVADCHRAMGSTWAGVASRDQSATAMEKAKASYQRFLELADPSDPFVPKVKAILDAIDDAAAADKLGPEAVAAFENTPPVGGGVNEFVTRMAAEVNAKNFERAVLLGEKCTRVFPKDPTCYRWLGSTYAKIATRDQSAADMEKARKNYERFVALAPPDNEYVPKVRAILAAAGPKRSDLVTNRDGSAADFATRINEARKQKNFDEAADLSQRCVAAYPNDPTCHRLLGTTYASLATRDQSAAAFVRAKAAYERFLELAPPDDEFVPKVRAILDNAPAAPSVDSTDFLRDARDVYLRGYQLKESSPLEAAKLFRQVMQMTPPDDETHQKAKSRIAEVRQRLNAEQLAELDASEAKPSSEEQYQRAVALFETDRTKSIQMMAQLAKTLPPSDPVQLKAREFIVNAMPKKEPLSPAHEKYLRAYQLKDTDPEEAKRLFREVMTMVPPGDETYEKAKTRIAQLEDRGPPEQLTVLRGTKKVVKYAIPIQRVALGDPNVLDVRTIGNDSLELSGATRGTTTLLVWMSDGTRLSHTVTVK